MQDAKPGLWPGRGGAQVVPSVWCRIGQIEKTSISAGDSAVCDTGESPYGELIHAL